MRRRPFTIFFTLSVAGPAIAVEVDCLAHFAALPEVAGNGQALVLDTYRRLFEQLGKGRIPAETLRAMDDPFALPERSEMGDLSVLRKNLQRLRQLVAARGWDTPELRAILREELSRQGSVRESAAQVQQKAVEQGPALTDVPLNTPRAVVMSPDRRWVIGVQVGPGKAKTLNVYDLKNKRLTAEPVPGDFEGLPLMMTDGTKVLFEDNVNVRSVPFHEGKFDWPKEKFLFSSTLPLIDLPFQHSNSPDVFFMPAWGQLYRYDLATDQKVVQVHLGETHSTSWRNIGGIPGTDKAYYVDAEGGQHRLYTGTTNQKGEFLNPEISASWPEEPGPLYFSADTKKIIASPAKRKQAAVIQTWGARTPPLSLTSARTKAADFGGEILGVSASPVGNVGYIFVAGASNRVLHIEKVNFETNQCEWSHEVARTFEVLPTVSADGQQLLFRDQYGNLAVLDLKQIDFMKGK